MRRLSCVIGTTGLFTFLLLGCADQQNTNGVLSGKTKNTPINLSKDTKTPFQKQTTQQLTSAKIAIDQVSLKRAIYRFRLSSKKEGGTEKIIGADLNSDGSGEALVYFEGDEWCISTGCQLVVFTRGPNGFRKMQQIKRVKLPIALSAQSAQGWRDIIVATGNQSIGERFVPLQFNGNYPQNATTITQKFNQIPVGSEILLQAP